MVQGKFVSYGKIKIAKVSNIKFWRAKCQFSTDMRKPGECCYLMVESYISYLFFLYILLSIIYLFVCRNPTDNQRLHIHTSVRDTKV